MAASLRKMGVYLGLVEDEEGYAEDIYDQEPALDPRRGAPVNRGHEPAQVEYSRDPARPMREWAPEPQSYAAEYDYPAEEQQPSYRITTLHPRTYNEAVTIGEHFRSGTPVIMNLSEMADSDAKRLVDFAAGLTFGLHGRVERVTAKVFLLSPQNVTVTAQDKAKLVEDGFFNQS
ncbi:MAG: cell division protein SepF [Jatrophihabitans sp.]